MDPQIEALIKSATGAEHILNSSIIQELWSGYGSIVRYTLKGSEYQSIIIKRIAPPSDRYHPRGWNTDRSHQRKLKSYQVETNWYRRFAHQCPDTCRIPRLLQHHSNGNQSLLLLEDLDHAGFPRRRTQVSLVEIQACLSWLAHFHAQFLHQVPDGLWETGTYWHLETRPDELAVLRKEDPALHLIAETLDQKLKGSRFQTIVHGDAKLANFCFSENGKSVAAVDFQYVGGGCGMKDLAYLLGSCFDEHTCARLEDELLDSYFETLKSALASLQRSSDFSALEADWRALYPIAWTDFHRFLKGWSPGHWKLNDYSEYVARSVIQSLHDQETPS
ncbi:MAG: phosphotransferase [Verrucomicrobiota bacterium]